MASSTKPAAVLLAVCAVSDLAAVPPMLSAADADRPPAGVAALVALLGVVTAIAAIGVLRGHRRSRSVALGTRIVDAVVALPALAAGSAAMTAAATTTVALSVVAVVVLVRGTLGAGASHDGDPEPSRGANYR